MGEPVRGSKNCISLEPLKKITTDKKFKDKVSLRGIDPNELFQMENSSGEICIDKYEPLEPSSNFTITFNQLIRRIHQIEGELKAREQNNIYDLKSEELCKKTAEIISSPFVSNNDYLFKFLSRVVLGAYACQSKELINIVDLLINKKYGGHSVVDIALTLPEDKAFASLKSLLEIDDAKSWASQKIKEFIENSSDDKKYNYLMDIASSNPMKAADLGDLLSSHKVFDLFKEIEKKSPEAVLTHSNHLPANVRFEFFMSNVKKCPILAAKNSHMLTGREDWNSLEK